MKLLCPQIISTGNSDPPRKGRKRSKETIALEKQEGQLVKKTKITKVGSEFGSDQDSIPGESTTNKRTAKKNEFVTTFEASPGSSHCYSEVEKKEEREHILTQTKKSRDNATTPFSDHSSCTEHSSVCKEHSEVSIVSDDVFLNENVSTNPCLQQHKNEHDSKFVDVKPKSDAIAAKEEVQNQPKDLQIPVLETYDARKDDIELSSSATNSVQCDLASKRPKSQDIDKDYFVEVSNQIYETLSNPQKSALLEQISSEEEFDDSRFTERLLAAIETDSDLPTIQVVDKDYFLEVANQIYSTMSNAEISLLLGGQDTEEFHDSQFTEMLLEAIDKDVSLQILDVDEEYFLEVANQIYETMSEPQKSILLGGIEEFDESHFLERLLADIDLDHVDDSTAAAVPITTLDPAELDDIVLKRSSSDL